MAQKLGKTRFWTVGMVLVVLATATGIMWSSIHRHSTQEDLQQEVLSIGAQLRVPSEQDTMTVATSPESVAQHMRYEIQQDVLKGQSRKQIISEMVNEYGRQVLAAPAKKGFGGLVWTMPIAALILGVTALSVYFLRSTAPSTSRSEKTSRPTRVDSGNGDYRDSAKLDEDIDKILQDYL